MSHTHPPTRDLLPSLGLPPCGTVGHTGPADDSCVEKPCVVHCVQCVVYVYAPSRVLLPHFGFVLPKIEGVARCYQGSCAVRAVTLAMREAVPSRDCDGMVAEEQGITESCRFLLVVVRCD